MKALTGLPTSAYLKVAEEAKIQLADLLQLVQHLEAGASPAFLARYRPDVSARLSEGQLRQVELRLREFLDLEDRRIMVLTAIRQQNRMTPELQKKIEETTDRYELEDYYLPFKPKRRTPADDATDQGLEPLARFLWDQPENADIEAVAATYVKPESGVGSAADALAGARHIVARWLGEDPEIRCALRPILREESELVVSPGDQPMREDPSQRKNPSLLGLRAKTGRVAWRQMMAIRRGARERWLRYHVVLPENRAVEHMLGRLIRDPRAAFCLQLGAAACEAFHLYLTPSFSNEVALALDERCDNEAVQSFQRNLRKLLMAPPAGPITVIGLETGRRGGWRAAVVGPSGEFLEGAIVYMPEGERAQENASGPEPRMEAAAGTEREAEAVSESKAEAAGGTVAEAGSPPAQGEPDQRAPAEGQATDTAPEPASDPAIAEAAAGVDGEATAPEPVAAAGEPTSADASMALSPSTQAEAESTSSTEAAPQAAGTSAVETTVQAASETDGKAATTPLAASPEAPQEPGQPGSRPRQRRDDRVEVPHASLSELIARHNVAAVVIGNGPGVRQVEKFIRGEVRQAGAREVFWTAIHEAGTWIYATSKTARREFPKADPVMRSAISLARRLQDPLCELVKVDPKVLGVGQYHHEVDAKKLRNGLRHTMEECIHQAGTDLNTAQLDELTLVPAFTERVAKRIVEHRGEKGKFRRREQLREVPGLNDRISEQSVGFLRVVGGDNPLDATGIHPSHYPVAAKIVAAAGVSAAEALEKPEVLDAVNLEALQSDEHPLELLKAVAREFRPSVRQPRGTFTPPASPIPLRAIEELKVGMKVEGIVTNLAKFGAFVDIGADQDGLVHVSQLSDKFIEDPQAAVKVGDRVAVHVLALEKDGKRISLSMKEPRPAQPRPGARRMAAAAGPRERDNGGLRRKRKGPERERGIERRTFGPDEQAKAREQREAEKLSIDQKLALLQSKFRTKVE
jgi:transcriptional accessory protein Tex/SPT6